MIKPRAARSMTLFQNKRKSMAVPAEFDNEQERFPENEISSRGTNPEMEKSPPEIFYCWECVTLVFKTRTLDLVIKDRR